MASESGVQPFVTHFQGKTKLTSCDFLTIFRQFDQDGNGFIEAGELDEFLKALWKEAHPGKDEPDSSEIASMKEEILQKFDENFDGKINLEELTKILPTEENFLAQFQHTTNLTSVDFFKVWTHYDVDRSGYIESNELEGFLVDLLGRGMSLDPQRISDYKNAMLDLFDKNKDGKLSLSEMSKILPVEENFLKRKMNDTQFDDIWCKYDQDGSGFIADDEIDALAHDLLKRDAEGDVEVEDIKKFKAVIMESFDTNQDGKIGKDELKLLLVKQKS